MAKDKSSKKISIRDLVAGDAQPSDDRPELKALEVEDIYNDEYNAKLTSYNESILEVDELYSTLIPTRSALVRAFVIPMKVVDGVIYPNKLPVKAPTANGPNGTYIGEMINPYPFSRKVVIVALPGGEKTAKIGDVEFTVGDTAILSQSQVRAMPLGKGDNAVVIIENSFTHPAEQDKYIDGAPNDPTDRNYGYLKVDPYLIDFKLPN